LGKITIRGEKMSAENLLLPVILSLLAFAYYVGGWGVVKGVGVIIFDGLLAYLVAILTAPVVGVLVFALLLWGTAYRLYRKTGKHFNVLFFTALVAFGMTLGLGISLFATVILAALPVDSSLNFDQLFVLTMIPVAGLVLMLFVAYISPATINNPAVVATTGTYLFFAFFLGAKSGMQLGLLPLMGGDEVVLTYAVTHGLFWVFFILTKIFTDSYTRSAGQSSDA
jgi:hypothetical protein